MNTQELVFQLVEKYYQENNIQRLIFSILRGETKSVNNLKWKQEEEEEEIMVQLTPLFVHSTLQRCFSDQSVNIGYVTSPITTYLIHLVVSTHGITHRGVERMVLHSTSTLNSKIFLDFMVRLYYAPLLCA